MLAELSKHVGKVSRIDQTCENPLGAELFAGEHSFGEPHGELRLTCNMVRSGNYGKKRKLCV